MLRLSFCLVAVAISCEQRASSRWRDAIDKNQVIRLERRVAEPRVDLPPSKSAVGPKSVPSLSGAPIPGTKGRLDIPPPLPAEVIPPGDAEPGTVPPIIITPDPDAAKTTKTPKVQSKDNYIVPPAPKLPPKSP